jgi:hypothetical protein
MAQSNEPAEIARQPAVDSRSGPGKVRSTRAVTSLLATGALLTGVVTTRGSFDKIFTDFGYNDFDVMLPMVTRVVRSALFVWFLGALFGLTALKEMLLKSTTKKLVWNIIVMYAALLLAAFYAVGMFRPLIVLVRSVSQ